MTCSFKTCKENCVDSKKLKKWFQKRSKDDKGWKNIKKNIRSKTKSSVGCVFLVC